MAENTANGQGTNTPDTEGTTQTAPIEPSGQQAGRTYTQAEVDELLGGFVEQSEVNRLVGEARRKARQKYEGYDEYKAQAEAHADYDEVASARDAATAEVESLKAQLARRDIVDRVSEETGVPGKLLKGETEDELRASAEAIRAYAGGAATAVAQATTYPADKGGGSTTKPLTKDEILAEKDTAKRRRLIAENLDLFE